jgi:xanthine/CO dehydrogenase XdhC/CoxF family maturation factor
MDTEPTAAEIIPDACFVAHGVTTEEPVARHLVVIYAGEMARHLTAFAGACGFRTTVVEPDPKLAAAAQAWSANVVADVGSAGCHDATDVVATDHHREDLGVVLAEALKESTRWIGVVGNPRLRGPHHELLAALGVDPEEVARVHRPIGLSIGSRTPPEVAVSTLAGLLADRAGKPGGFEFGT